MKRRHFLGLLGAAGISLTTGVAAKAADPADVKGMPIFYTHPAYKDSSH